MPIRAGLSAGLWIALPLLLGSCAFKSNIRAPLPHVSSVESPSFQQALGAQLGATWSQGNKIVALNNGDEIFPAMLETIRGAKRTINFETFVYSKGDIPAEFAQAFAERARAGVRVNMTLDAYGCLAAARYESMFRDAGINVEFYHSVWRVSPLRYIFRTHRKYLIVDGKIGFIGGVGIDDRWKGNARNPAEWREMHFKVEGPAVAQLQAGFAENWLKTHQEVLQGPDYFPPLKAAGHVTAAAFQSAPSHGRFDIELMYHMAISSAKRSLLIANPYFLPNAEIQNALCAAAARGVQVVILVPGKNMDAPIVTRASKKCWPKLMACGVKIFQYEPTMIHSKLLIADGRFVSVGSGNFDPRSLRINDEANLNILDAKFARQMIQTFATDLRKSKSANHESPSSDLTEILLQTLQTPLEDQM